jgi:hypothetical protein
VAFSPKPFCKKTGFKPSGKPEKTWFLVIFEISTTSFALPEMGPKQYYE